MAAGSQDLLPTEGDFETDVADADVDKLEPGEVAAEGPGTDNRGGAPTDEAGINFGGPGLS